ncbi:MAG TPA: hypothetical protein VMK53_10575 [Gemmatimonadales bacterium]|nr:hypothetical protein [Gemmatimonadales bacterium]
MMPVFVNEKPVQVAAGGTALEAVAALDQDLSDRLAAGDAYVTDGRGIRLAPEEVLSSGAILRVIVSARRAPDADA